MNEDDKSSTGTVLTESGVIWEGVGWYVFVDLSLNSCIHLQFFTVELQHRTGGEFGLRGGGVGGLEAHIRVAVEVGVLERFDDVVEDKQEEEERNDENEEEDIGERYGLR